jgi:outer membrane protein assembly factor BamB
VKTDGPMYSSPAVCEETVYAASWDRRIYAVGATSGERVGSFATNGPIVSSPAVRNGVLYVGSGDGVLYALNVPCGAPPASAAGAHQAGAGS